MKAIKPLIMTLSIILQFAFAGCSLKINDSAPAVSDAGTTQTESPSRDAGKTEPAPSVKPSFTPEPETADGLILMHCSVGKPAADTPELVFSLYGKENPDGYFVEMVLNINYAGGGELLYEASHEVLGDFTDYHVYMEDANFDGFSDLLYTEGPIGAHAHLWYHLLIWLPEKNGFIPAESFYEIANPVIDTKDAVIRSFGANSAYEDAYTIYRCEAVENSFRYVPELHLELLIGEENETLTYTKYRYENGVRIQESVIETVLPADPNHPDQKEFYDPDSIWKLDDPIWYQNRHFEEAGE